MPFDPSTAAPFDPSSATPVAAGGFDPSTAQEATGPVTSGVPQPDAREQAYMSQVKPAPEVEARNARIERMRAKPPDITDKIVGAVEAGLNALTTITNFAPNVGANLLTGQHPLEGSYSQNVYQPRSDTGQEYVEDVVQPAMNQMGPLLGHGHEMAHAAPAIAPAVRAAGDVVRPVATAAGDAAVRGTAKMIGVDPELAKVARTAGELKYPIDVRPDQVKQGAKFTKLAGQASSDVPFSGSKTKSNQVNFTKNVIHELNPEDTSDRLTPENFSKAMERSGGGIGDIMAKTEIPLDAPLRDSTTGLREEVNTKGTDADAKIISAYIDELHSKANEDGIIDGSALRELNSEIGLRARNNVGNDLGAWLNDLQGHIEDAVQRNVSPEDGAALKEFRRQYAYGKILEPTVAKTIDGVLPPSQLMGAVTRTSLGKHLMAMGKGGPLGDLAKVGQLIKEPGTSFTAERGAVYAGIGGAAHFEPHTAAGVVGAANIYNRLGPKLTRAMVKDRTKGAAPPPEPPPAPPAEPTTSPGAGGPYPPGGGGGGGAGPLGDLTPDWQTTPGAGGGPPRGGHEPGLVRSVDETEPLPQGMPPGKPGSQIPVHEPRPLGDVSPDWTTAPGAGGTGRGEVPTGLHRAAGEPTVSTGSRKARPEMPLVPGRPDLPDTMVSGGPAETAASERANKAMGEPGAVEARKQQGKKPPEGEGGDEGGGGGGGGKPAPEMPKGGGPSRAETERLLAEEKTPAVRKVLQDHLKKLDADDTEAASKVAREHDAQALEKAARSTTDPALQARLLKQADALRGTEKIPVGKTIEGQPPIKEPKLPEKIPAGDATEITPEYVEADRAWRAEHKLGSEDAQRARDVAEALTHDEPAVHKAVRQFEHQPRAFDREIARITEEGKARENESQLAARSGASDATAAEGAGAPVRSGEGSPPVRDGGGNASEPVSGANGEAGRNAEPQPDTAVRGANEQPGADSVPEAGRGQGAGAGAAGGQEATGAKVKPPVAKDSMLERLKAEGEAQKKRLATADIERAGEPPKAAEIREVPGGFEAYRDGKKVGYLKDNLERGQAEQLGENANVDMVKVDKAEQGKGTGRALYDAFNEKHGGRIMPSGKTEPSAWKLWKRNYPDKVDAFVKQEAARIRDGADPKLVAGNITDPEIRARVLKESEPPPSGPKPFVPKEKSDAASKPSDTGAVQPKADEGEEIFKGEATPEPFYSQLTRSVEGLKQGKADAGQWMGILKNLKGVKPEEIAWSGVEDWLKAQGGSVTREALANYLREGGVKVTEVTKGGNDVGALPTELKQYYENSGRGIPDSAAKWTEDSAYFERRANKAEPHTPEWERSWRLAQHATDMAERYETDSGKAHGTPKYSTYQLPGGTNYREVLLTLPEKQPEGWKIVTGDDGKFNLQKPDGTLHTDPSGNTAYWSNRDAAESALHFNSKNTAGNYTSPHWDEKNVLAHIRLNDRVDADGKKVLFVEEVQSDWAQQGKKRGFGGDNEKLKAQLEQMKQEQRANWKEREDVIRAMTKRHQDFRAENPDADVISRDLQQKRDADLTRIQQLEDRYKELQPQIYELDHKVKRSDTVPSAPFVGKTDAWTSLAIKRVAKMAADEGYDRVAFINGEQSADRYDLSKQVETVHYDRDTGELVATDKYGDEVVREHVAATPEAMAEYIGDEPAKKLARKIEHTDQRVAEERSMWSTEQDEDTGRWFLRDTDGEAYHDHGGELVDFPSERSAERAIDEHFRENPPSHPTVRGLDLKVGGEGMKAFYDKILPNVAKDVVKKLGGDGLTTSDVDGIQRDGWVVKDKDGKTVAYQYDNAEGQGASMYFPTAEAARQAAGEHGGTWSHQLQNSSPQTAFDITPQMRANAEGGVPLFKQGGEQPAPGKQFMQSHEELNRALRDKFGEKLIDGLLEQGVLKFAKNADEQPANRSGIKAIMRRPPEGQSSATLYYDKMTAEEAPKILMHELGEHFGIIRLLGQERYNVMLNDLRKLKDDPEVRAVWDHVKTHYVGHFVVDGNGKLIRGGIESKAAADKLAAANPGASVHESLMKLSTEDPQFIREVAAHLVETQPHLPFVRRIINEIRAFFYEKFGTTMANRVDADLIRGLAASALRKASTGALPNMKTGMPLVPTVPRPFVPRSAAP